MTTVSNLYAERVFAEHPVGLWSLDEPVDYVSLVSEVNRDLSTATATSLPSEETPTVQIYTPEDVIPSEFPALIFPDSLVNQLTLPDIGVGETETSSFITSDTFYFQDLNYLLGSFSISTYVFPFAKRINLTIGYQYYDTDIEDTVRHTRTFYISDVQQWAYITETFELPTVPEDTAAQLIFEISYTGATTGYYALLHGITVGQWSEQFSVESLGTNLFPFNLLRRVAGLPELIVGNMGTEANAYGLQSTNGYYLADQGVLRATNSGLPMVYGSSSSTVVTPNSNGEPSLVVPGFGFMNEDGKYKDLTLELWLKIQSSATDLRRIIGPINSSDGLYVDDAFLILKVGDQFGSYYIGEWDRPMLTAIRMSGDGASLVINGEEVITLSFIGVDISFPVRYHTDGGGSYDNDWIGVYAYQDVPRIEVDCIGIYPYIVPSIVEKRRFVYGQGVEVPDNISGSNLGTDIAVDFTLANYAKSYIYPDIGRWQQGINENLSIDNSAISIPDYPLPSVTFDNKTTDAWYSDISDYTTLYGPAATLKPNTSWDSTEGYILFDTVNLLEQDVKAFYALMESDETVETKQTIFYLENQVSGDILEVALEGTDTTYTLKYLNSDGTVEETTFYTDTTHTPGGFLFVGINIDPFATAPWSELLPEAGIESINGKLLQFFGAKQEVKLYVGGNRNFTNTFAGNIFRVGFCTARNLQKISNVFTSNGIAVGYNSIDSVGPLDAGDIFFGNGYSSSTSPDPTQVDLFTGDVWYNTSDSNYYVFDSDIANGTWIVQSSIPSTYWAALADGGNQYFGNLNTPYDDIYDGGGVYSVLIDTMLAHIASYTLFPKSLFTGFVLDVATNGYWQDYQPLSYFGKYVDDGNGNKYYDLDFVQFNITYPPINKFVKNAYDTADSIVKTYVSFQYLKSASTVNVNNFNTVEAAPKTGVIEPGTNWQKTKYEVVNDMVIYPPQNVDFQTLALVTHIEIFSNGKKENPVKIQSLQLSSQALNAFMANPVGTKYGSDIYPYRKSGEYFDYKGRNPFTIYKGSTPHFYLTSTSGLRLKGITGRSYERGFSIPINKNRSDYYKVNAWQMALRFDDETFPTDVTELFQIEARGKESAYQFIKFYMKPDIGNTKRGVIYAIDALTGLEKDGIMFYINGRKVKHPVININSWTMLGVVFNSPVDFSANVGALRITGPIIFNNVSHYQASQADEASRSIFRKWSSVKSVDASDVDWEYWKDLEVVVGQTFTWRNVLFISSNDAVAINGTTIFKKYTGTDRITIDSDEVFRIHDYQYQVYQDLIWKSAVVTSA